jgi:hypothetical protein
LDSEGNNVKHIFDLEKGQLTKDILLQKFTGYIAFISFVESDFGIMLIDDIGVITDIV